MKRWVFNPSLNCSRLTEVERRCVGSEFETTGAATWKLRWPNRVLVGGTSMSQRSAERRCARPEMSATGTHRRPRNKLGRCRSHSFVMRCVTQWNLALTQLCDNFTQQTSDVKASQQSGVKTSTVWRPPPGLSSDLH